MPVVSHVWVENFLSFQSSEVALGGMNVLVGPNGAGKSNFLKIFKFIAEVARQDLNGAIDEFGGFNNLRFRGDREKGRVSLKFSGVMTKYASDNAPDQYSLNFIEVMTPPGRRMPEKRYLSRDEEILTKRLKGVGRRMTLKGGNFRVVPITSGRADSSKGKLVEVQSESSGLNTIRKLGEQYGASQVESIAKVFEDLRHFEVDVERVRRPSSAPMGKYLHADASNLAPFLMWLSLEHPAAFESVCADVRHILPSFKSIDFVRLGGSDSAVRVDIVEAHLTDATPLAHASFGTIRSLALFAMLHDPYPPRLTCLEELDHGLHPHALDRLVLRLREAADRTQIIAATHSPALVNRLDPQELIIFEKDPENSATRVVNIDAAEVRNMEAESGYGLGELWFSGLLGGGLES